MKLVILDERSRFRDEDLKRLDEFKPVFYENEDNKLSDIKELYGNEDVILGVQPSYVAGAWEGLPYDEVKKLTALKGLALSTTAFGWAPYKELGEKGIPVTNVPGKSTIAVAEYYISMMISLLRRLPLIRNNKGNKDFRIPMGSNAKGLTLGVVGLGSIGQRFAEIATALGMNVIYYNRSEKSVAYRQVDLPKLFVEADVVFISIAADPATKGLVTKEHISLMKKEGIILSAVEHLVYDFDFIIDQVQADKLGGFGCEGEEEFNTGNILVSDEIGYYTKQTMETESEVMTDCMISLMRGTPINRVN